MNRRNVLHFTSLAGAATLLSGCWMFPAEWYEKLTVTVETPTGDKSGSSVRWQKLAEDMLLDRATSDFAGEAVVVEVAPRKYLFVLLEENMPQAELIYFPGEPPLKSTHKLNDVKGKVVDVPSDQYPLMVTFGSLADPKSIKQVLPNDLAAAFGSGYRLKSVKLEIVVGPVTIGKIEELLPWLKSLHGSIVKGMNLPYEHILKRVHNGLFVRKMKNG
jgi:hypothetical protein